MIVTCDCGAKLKIDDAKLGGRRIKVRCPRCGNVLPVQSAPQSLQVDSTVSGKAPGPAQSPKGPLVLVAHDSDVVRNTVCEVLIDSGFQVDTAANGMEALTKATQMIPRGLVLDVGLAGSIYGFEVCERLKNSPKTSGIKIILLSSVYDMRRYKRTPNSLYGADDYIEKHHIPDFLPSKMRRLIFPEEFADKQPKTTTPFREELPEMSRPPAREFKPFLLNNTTLQPQASPDFSNPSPVPPRTAMAKAVTGDIQESVDISPDSFSLEASIFQKEECDIPRVDAADPQAIEKARRFARIIVSDIALYNHDLVIEGIMEGTFYELLRNDIQEGRELYEKRVPPAIRTKKDYYQEAFDNFLAASKQKNVR
jgi:predicted Zn finger-like uncharacterized protein